jgi:hypothetical protein
MPQKDAELTSSKINQYNYKYRRKFLVTNKAKISYLKVKIPFGKCTVLIFPGKEVLQLLNG